MSFFLPFRFSLLERKKEKKKKEEQGKSFSSNFILTVDAPAEVDEGSVDLDGRDRADDDVAWVVLMADFFFSKMREREEKK